jgi:hypothetical protein
MLRHSEKIQIKRICNLKTIYILQYEMAKICTWFFWMMHVTPAQFRRWLFVGRIKNSETFKNIGKIATDEQNLRFNRSTLNNVERKCAGVLSPASPRDTLDAHMLPKQRSELLFISGKQEVSVSRRVSCGLPNSIAYLLSQQEPHDREKLYDENYYCQSDDTY